LRLGYNLPGVEALGGVMRWFFLALAIALGAAWLAGVRIFVVPPIGAIPDGATVLVSGAPGLHIVDSADAVCTRTTGNVTILCRAIGLGVIAKTSILLRLPYSSSLDALAMALSPAGSEPLSDVSDSPRLTPEPVVDTFPCLSLKVDRVYMSYDHPSALVTVTNSCDRGFASIFINCTWLNQGSPVATGLGLIENLTPGQVDSADVSSPEKITMDSARCRITNVHQ
jgi:hypothetical protein